MLRVKLCGVALVAFVIWGTAYSPLPASAASPDNDDLLNAASIKHLPFSDNVDTTEANDGGCFVEPDRFCHDELHHTVWYKFSPKADVNAEISTAGSDYDTAICIGQIISSEGFFSISVICRDDVGSQETFPVTFKEGATYYLLVGTGGTEGGNLALSIKSIKFDVTIDSKAALDEGTGSFTVSGTVRCNPEQSNVFLIVGAVQVQAADEVRGGSSQLLALCDGKTRWTAVVGAGIEQKFEQGEVEVQVIANSEFGSAQNIVVENVRLNANA